jgi:hypothetical protein
MCVVVESVTVTWSWQPAGQVALVDGRLVFPRVPNVAGIYRFLFSDAAGVQRQMYVGEADLLTRRLQHYRTPGPSQPTNLRLNQLMVETLGAGGRIAVEIATQAQAVISDEMSAALDLTSKAVRVLVERAAEVMARTAGAVLLKFQVTVGGQRLHIGVHSLGEGASEAAAFRDVGRGR